MPSRSCIVQCQSLRDDCRRRAYAAQVSQRRLVLFGIQEARQQTTEVREWSGMVVATSACDGASRFGCELWLPKAAVWASTGAVDHTYSLTLGDCWLRFALGQCSLMRVCFTDRTDLHLKILASGGCGQKNYA